MKYSKQYISLLVLMSCSFISFVSSGEARAAIDEDPAAIDDDGDGQNEYQGDCNDADPTMYYGAVDYCGDTADSNCWMGDADCVASGSEAEDPTTIDDDGDGESEAQGDCNDADALIYSGATEVCGDGVDNDCSGGDALCEEDLPVDPATTDDDGDGQSEAQGDCNDADALIYSGATEVCGDGIDNDCTGGDVACESGGAGEDPAAIDNDGDGQNEYQGDCNDADPTMYYGAMDYCGDTADSNCWMGDADCVGDGGIDPLSTDDDGDGQSEAQGDCNDVDPLVYSGATEVCSDGIDNDCVDGDEVCVDPFAIDDDGDGQSESQGDCNDIDALIYAGATEVCGDGIDNDCIDGDAVCVDPLTTDDDGDGQSEEQGDCNDADPLIYAGALEICEDHVDNDCVDGDDWCVPEEEPEDPAETDDDGDGQSEAQGDCNDADLLVYAGAVEVCGDGIDNDCGDGDAACIDPLAVDDDGDGQTESQGDCNDADVLIYAGALEICGDSIDNDCAGGDAVCHEDEGEDPSTTDDDGDGQSESQGDCNDADALIYAGATEVCGDEIDNDCAGGDSMCNNEEEEDDPSPCPTHCNHHEDPLDVDNDGDGFTENQGDCNDADATIHPNCGESCDGIDNDCDEAIDEGNVCEEALENVNDVSEEELPSSEEEGSDPIDNLEDDNAGDPVDPNPSDNTSNQAETGDSPLGCSLNQFSSQKPATSAMFIIASLSLLGGLRLHRAIKAQS